MLLSEDARKILLTDYQEVEIIDREELKKEIKEKIFDSLLNGLALSVYCYGSSGTGKTFIWKKMFEKYIPEIKSKYNFRFIWLNGNDVKTSYSLFWNIIKQLCDLLPVKTNYGIVTELKQRGYGTSELIEIVRSLVEEKNLIVMVVIDEVDKILFYRGEDDSFLLSLLDMNSNCKRGSIGIVAISNNIYLDQFFSTAVNSRFPFKIHFPKYSINDLLELLRYYANLTLPKDSYTDEDLLKIAKIVGDETGSIRDAKALLFSLAIVSESKLDTSKIEKAIELKNKEMYRTEIAKLPIQQKICLNSIILQNKIYFERKIELIRTGKGLIKFIDDPNVLPTINNCYKIYKILCENLKMIALSLSAYRNSLKELEKNNLIDIRIKSFGRAGGITSICFLSFDVNILEELLREVLW